MASSSSTGSRTSPYVSLFNFFLLFLLIFDHDYVFSETPLNNYFLVVGFAGIVWGLLNVDSIWTTALYCVLQLAFTVHSLPFLGNHSGIQATTSLCLIFLFVAAGMKSGWTAAALENAFLEMQMPFRVLLHIFYFAATFHKLNWDYLLSAESCGPFVTNKLLEVLHLGPIRSPITDTLAIWGALVVEGLVPLLLIFGRTRKLALLALCVFHLFLGLRFAEFPPFLISLFIFYLSPDEAAAMAAQLPQNRVDAFSQWAYSIVLFGLAICLRFVILPFPTGHGLASFTVSSIFFFWFWKGLSRPAEAYHPRQGSTLMWVTTGFLFLIQFLVFSLPYLGVRTTSVMAMYSNLRTEGYSNHVLIPHIGWAPEADDLIDFDKDAYPLLEKLNYMYTLSPRAPVIQLPALEVGRLLAAATEDERRQIASFQRSGKPDAEILALGPKFQKLPWIKQFLYTYHPLNKGEPACMW